MRLDNPALIAQIAGFGTFLWVGMYLMVRAPSRTPLIVVSLIGLFAQAAYFGTGALADTTANPGLFIALEKGFWWTTVLPAAAWFHVSSLIVRRPFRLESRRALYLLFTRRVAVIYTLALCIALLGSFSDLLVDHSHPLRVSGGYVVVPGPAYPLYIAYLGLAAAGAFVNLARARGRLARRADSAGQAMARQLRLL